MKNQRSIKFKLYYQNQLFGYEFLTENGWQYCTLELDTDENGNFKRTHLGTIPHYFIQDKNNLVRAEWTGLYDENNQEVYEGDIYNRGGHNLTVEYVEIGSCGGDILGIGFDTEDAYKGKFPHEIIGNKFENQNLLS